MKVHCGQTRYQSVAGEGSATGRAQPGAVRCRGECLRLPGAREHPQGGR